MNSIIDKLPQPIFNIINNYLIKDVKHTFLRQYKFAIYVATQTRQSNYQIKTQKIQKFWWINYVNEDIEESLEIYKGWY